MNKEQSIHDINDAPEGPPTTETDAVIADFEEKTAKLEAEKRELQSQMLRTVADAQNILKRTREQHGDSIKFASQSLVTALLPIIDNFERTLASLESGASLDKVLEGIGAIDRQVKQAMVANGVTRISAVGEQFDPHRHEAVSTVISKDHEDGTVISELEPGYMLHDRVVRPARVQVAKRP